MAVTLNDSSMMRRVDGQPRTDALPSLLQPSTLMPAEMEILLDDDRPFYTNLDEVRGKVRYAQDLQIEGTVLLVSLIGISQVIQLEWIQDIASYRTVQTEWPFLKQTEQIDLDMDTCESSFSFRLPSFLQPMQCPIGDIHHMDLPPSTGLVAANGQSVDREQGTNLWQIVYEIRAELVPLDDPKALKYVNRPFQFLPKMRISKGLASDESSIQPPLVMTEKLTNLVGQCQGDLAMIVDRDAVLEIHNDGAASSLPLSLRYKGRDPPKITKIGMTLVIRTSKRTRHNPLSYHDESVITIERGLRSIGAKDMPLSTWSASNTELHTYDNRIDLPVALQNAFPGIILPSFNSCLVTRRYELRITFSFSTSSTIPLRQKSFQFPVVLEPVVEPENTAAEPIEQEKESAPSYAATIAAISAVAPITRVPAYSDPIPDLEQQRLPYWREKSHSGHSELVCCAAAC